MTYDVAVCGLGAMGSAALAHCARRGLRAIGVEQFGRGHTLGASAGKTRMIRKAYFEDPAYVPMLLRAYDLWRDLERAAQTHLLQLTGLLMAGEEQSEIVAGSSLAASRYGLPVEHLSARDIRSRFPKLQPRPDEVGVYERDGGIVFPERAIEAHLRVAENAGAALRFNSPMQSWESGGDRATLRLADGSEIEAGALVLTTGPWIAAAFAAFGVEIRVQRNVQLWFAPQTHAYDAGAFPSFLLDRKEFAGPLYGFPDLGDGVKAAFHGAGTITTPASLERAVDEARDIAPVAEALDAWMPGAAGRFLEAKACMYSLTGDGNFVVDRHPQHANVVVCGGFSGHGFKFAPVVGEAAAQLASGETPPYDLRFLSAKRFAS